MFEGVDLEDVSLISLGFYRSGGNTFSHFRTVPEPRVSVFLLLGLIVVTAVRRN